MFSPDEIADLRADQEAHMPDVCVRVVRQETGQRDARGNKLYADADVASLPCRFAETLTTEGREGNEVTVTQANATLPVGTVVANEDMIRVDERRDVPGWQPTKFKVAGDPLRSAVRVRVLLERAG